MLAELRVGVKAGAGVVEVDVTGRVKARELCPPQPVEHRGLGVARMGAPEGALGLLRSFCRLGVGDGWLAHWSVLAVDGHSALINSWSRTSDRVRRVHRPIGA